MLSFLSLLLAAAVTGSDQVPASPESPPWEQPRAIIIPDVFWQNKFDFRKVAAEGHKIDAVILRASIGHSTDCRLYQRATEARNQRFRLGIYHFGLAGDPLGQAKLFVEEIRLSRATFLALDLDGEDFKIFMSPAEAIIFLDYVHNETGKWPVVYTFADMVNKNISPSYDRSSSFGQTELWLAAPPPPLDPVISRRIWSDYRLRQFTSDAMCLHHTAPLPCPIVVDGTDGGTDFNVFTGSLNDRDMLFTATKKMLAMPSGTPPVLQCPAPKRHSG